MSAPNNRTETRKTRKTILVVDDDPDARLLLSMAMENEGADVELTYVNDGEQALNRLQAKPGSEGPRQPIPDLMLLDLRMPRVDGFEVLERLRRTPALRPKSIFIITTSHETRDRDRAFALGADGYLVKPSGFEDLRRQTRALLDFLRTGVWPSDANLKGCELRGMPA